jgi:uncharacterized protein (DUF58 family)
VTDERRAAPGSERSSGGGVRASESHAGRPGPTAEHLLRALDLRVGRRVRGLVAGEFRAIDLGPGTELAKIRPYEPGDDVRSIDWNVTARTGQTHVRVHVPERGVTTWLLLDASPSMEFGTADRRKADVAEGVAVAIAHLATQRGNRMSLLTFGGRQRHRTRPAAGRRGLMAALVGVRAATERRRPMGPRPAAKGIRNRIRIDAPALVPDPVGATSPAEALRLVTFGAPRGGVVVVVSDFRGPRDWTGRLAECSRRHAVIAVEIRDPREDALPDVGELTLVDGETGREVRVNTSSRPLRERFAAAAADERTGVAREFRRIGVRHVVLSTSGDWLFALARQLSPRSVVS